MQFTPGRFRCDGECRGVHSRVMSQHPARVFLGWDGPLLVRAVDWLIQEFADNCSEVVIALPGGRAGRILQEKLARAQVSGWQPPRILTQGELTDYLVDLEANAADRIVRTLVWEKALRAAPKAALERLLRTAPKADDAGAWSRLSETLRTLHGELAPEGCEFASVAKLLEDNGNAGESARWQTLATIQSAYRDELKKLGLSDPHEARSAAIASGAVACAKRIVLVGVADMNHLLRRALESVASQVTALVFAPEAEAKSFDEWGCLLIDAWKDRNVPLDREDWLVADKPVDQARLVSEWLASQGSELRTEQVTIGIADEEVAPFVERRLASAQVRARHAAGFPMGRTLPFRLIEAIAVFAQSQSWTDWAALVRHPDLESVSEKLDGASVSDRYHGEFLPDHVEGEMHGKRRRAEDMRDLSSSLKSLFGKLIGTKRRAISEWSSMIRAVLISVYGERDYDDAIESERVSAACLKDVGGMLTTIENLPQALTAEPCSAGEALSFVLRELRSGFIPPAPVSVDEPTIELLGWLELPLDDAEYLAVTGFSDGRVPEAMAGDPFLPNGLRTSLNLVDADARQARDVHEMTVLCNSRKVVFVTGRRTASGDPLVPSRLAFHCEPEETPERVRKFIDVGVAAQPEAGTTEKTQSMSCPGREGVPRVESISVTAFRDFLSSPYQYYLRRVLKLNTLDDDARELDAAQFGTLAHRALEDFGRSAAKDALDARTIEAELQANLKRIAREQYGNNPVPAVVLQLEQLSYRFHLFAQKQEAWAREGWKIEHVEWAPEGGGKALSVDGQDIQIRGKIDRIDRNTRTGEWAILDYKSSDKAKSPKTEHFTGKDPKRWKDLQLPLYCHLTSSLGMESIPRLGYVNVGRESSSVRFWLIDEKDCDEDLLIEAHEVASEIVRKIRAEEFFDPGRGKAYDPITQALCGVGVMEAGDDGEEDEL